MKYIKPLMKVESIEAEQLMALSLKSGNADDSEVLVNEEKSVETTTTNVWDKEW